MPSGPLTVPVTNESAIRFSTACELRVKVAGSGGCVGVEKRVCSCEGVLPVGGRSWVAHRGDCMLTGYLLCLQEYATFKKHWLQRELLHN